MKRKICIMLLIAATAMCLSACTAGKQEETAFHLNIKTDCDEAVYALHAEYFIDGKAVSGSTVSNANETAFKHEETVSFEVIPADFPEDADITAFSFELYVMLKDGGEYPCGTAAVEAKYGESYDFTVSGSAANGFTLK